MAPELAAAYAVVLAAVHLIGEHIDATHPHYSGVTAFSAGVTITYIFLALLPEHHAGTLVLGDWGYLTGLAGFTAIHTAKQWLYRHERSIEELRHEFKELHSIFIFLYYLGIGAVLTTLLRRGTIPGTLFFLPVILHAGLSSLSLSELHEDVVDNPFVKLGVAAAPFLGVLLSTVHPAVAVQHALLGFVTGMFLYIAVHDALPVQSDAHPRAYILGTLLYAAVIVASWLLV